MSHGVMEVQFDSRNAEESVTEINKKKDVYRSVVLTCILFLRFCFRLFRILCWFFFLWVVYSTQSEREECPKRYWLVAVLFWLDKYSGHHPMCPIRTWVYSKIGPFIFGWWPFHEYFIISCTPFPCFACQKFAVCTLLFTKKIIIIRLSVKTNRDALRASRSVLTDYKFGMFCSSRAIRSWQCPWWTWRIKIHLSIW